MHLLGSDDGVRISRISDHEGDPASPHGHGRRLGRDDQHSGLATTGKVERLVATVGHHAMDTSEHRFRLRR